MIDRSSAALDRDSIRAPASCAAAGALQAHRAAQPVSWRRRIACAAGVCSTALSRVTYNCAMTKLLASLLGLRAFEVMRYRQYRLLCYGQVFGKRWATGWTRWRAAG